jgi:hypothetical protein
VSVGQRLLLCEQQPAAGTLLLSQQSPLWSTCRARKTWAGAVGMGIAQAHGNGLERLLQATRHPTEPREISPA